MKRKTSIALILALLLIVVTAKSVKADNSGLIFIVTNDKMYDLSTIATNSNGVFVPTSVFADFSINTNFFSSNNTVMLYNNNKQIFFDIGNGNSYDSDGNYYDAAAIVNGSCTYVPASWTSSFFGLSYSYITGNGYGDIARITNGTQVLSNNQYINAAGSLMQQYYNTYFGITDTNPTQKPSITPTPAPSPDEEEDKSNVFISIAFKGMPDKKILDTLESYNIKAAFFVTATEVIETPDTVRRICGSGHEIGIYCSEDIAQECDMAFDIIFEAAQIRPLLVTSDIEVADDCTKYANSNALAYYTPNLLSDENVAHSQEIITKLEPLSSTVRLMLTVTDSTSDYLSSLLNYLSVEKYNIVPCTIIFC